ncbi:hypothetical protein OK016_01255 [Vibrio chagasii]|nr:hypothetical protein [Vibrio chagasii]
MSVGNDVELFADHNCFPTDESCSVDWWRSGLLTGDQINIAFVYKVKTPQVMSLCDQCAEVTVFDRVDPSAESVNISNVETSSAAIEGTFSNIGSDNLNQQSSMQVH